ncbi:folylpolyglutamate synthase/dihydrofolate synthase family protein [Carboxylicivirga sp. M1479]|uniref:bifunctional folylpolyglutamate synthase/dihydrofolate synthase n=1 Tax=Carboxylicivirga sp. M1479 TaxID=2594476 RepID=UPI001178C594|nr:folylpolyglutamate synthase/dihydrofolate synthase family protein [Carboxylicivirga sp. M1479]TRX65767.1 bifunctional folylpolyglutamate synthase/dihydrofolate synthase [Carboxylicivirga sp. M1479]
MNYKETLDFLFAQLPMYQRVGKAAYKADLETTLALDKYFQHPHKAYKTIHIGGTNGKGSVSHCIASILQEAGYKVGLYTSPHLKDFRERIRINGEMISEQAVVDFVGQHQQIIQSLQPSFFEMSVAMAFDYFKKEEIDIAIMEVGMGGRLDSTNIISPLISAITNIGLDHTAFLGNSLDKIAYEKAGIIKKDVPLIIGQSHTQTAPVFKAVAKEKETNIVFADQNFEISTATFSIDEKQIFQIYKDEQLVYKDLKLDLLGSYQQKNIITVLACVEQLQKQGVSITTKHLYDGLENVVNNTGLLGRWQHLGYNPRIVCDTGHNLDGMIMLVEQIQNTPHDQLHFVLGMVNDKDHEAVLDILPKKASYYFTKASIPRSLNENTLQEMAQKHGLNGKTYHSVDKALEAAKKNASDNDLIFIGGSTFIVADILENIN